jgi:hypothetical protein
VNKENPVRRPLSLFVIATIAGLAACTSPADEEEIDASESELGEGRVLNVDYQAQQTGYWCGPAATRFVISARRGAPSQRELANQLGTTSNGTDWIGQVTKVLNQHFGPGTYVTREMPNDPPTREQRDRLWDDIVSSIDGGWGIVANIVAPPHNHPPGYPNRTIYHYVAVIGYKPGARQVYIADSANFSGQKLYWISFDQLASLIPPKGYATSTRGPANASCPGARGSAGGAIADKYRAIGGCGSLIGAPITNELGTPDRRGRYNVFERGSIYWTPETGAFEVHGAIRDQWKELGWEAGVLGYPISDERGTPDHRGRYNVFEKGSIYFTPDTGAHEVLGRIRDEYEARGWEAGPLGYPTSGEYAVPEGRKADFEHGSITWRTATDDFDVRISPR